MQLSELPAGTYVVVDTDTGTIVDAQGCKLVCVADIPSAEFGEALDNDQEARLMGFIHGTELEVGL